jgi:hypothetical protein
MLMLVQGLSAGSQGSGRWAAAVPWPFVCQAPLQQKAWWMYWLPCAHRRLGRRSVPVVAVCALLSCVLVLCQQQQQQLTCRLLGTSSLWGSVLAQLLPVSLIHCSTAIHPCRRQIWLPSYRRCCASPAHLLWQVLPVSINSPSTAVSLLLASRLLSQCIRSDVCCVPLPPAVVGCVPHSPQHSRLPPRCCTVKFTRAMLLS